MLAPWLFIASYSICKSCSNYPLLLKFARIIFHNFFSTLTPFSCAIVSLCYTMLAPWLFTTSCSICKPCSDYPLLMHTNQEKVEPSGLFLAIALFYFLGKAMEMSLHNFLLLVYCGNWGSFSASLPFPVLSKRQSNGRLSLLIIFVLFSFILIEEGLELFSPFITLSLDKAMSKSSLDNFPLLLRVNWRMFSASLPIQYFLFAK